MKRNLKAYFAAGWFNSQQIETYYKIVTLLKSLSTQFDVFLPREASKDLQDSLDSSEVRTKIFQRNLEALKNTDFIICSTESKDTGSIFDATYGYALGKPVVYVNYHLKGKFNLMLAESCIAIATSHVELMNILAIIVTEGLNSKKLKNFKQLATVE